MSTEWLSDIAKKLELDISKVNEIVSIHHIKPSPIVPRPKRLALKRINFSGEKTSGNNIGPFTFDWDELGPGLWGILSERNQRGKSSIIGVVQWLLRGRSTSLQDDVLKWIHKASLQFSFDDDTYDVFAKNEEEITGNLSRIDAHGEAHEIVSFSNEFEFERVMSDFMMRQLSLEPVVIWNGDAQAEGGKLVIHEWPFLSGAMFIGTNYASLLGDNFIPGISVRLMQMYLGLPWVSTLTEAKASEKSLKNESNLVERKATEEKEKYEIRVQEIQYKIDKIKSELLKLPSSKQATSTHSNICERLKLTFNKIHIAEKEVEDYLRNQQEALNALRSDKKELQSFVDAHAAGAVFRRLTPTICPRCEANIPESRLLEEQESGECSICKEHIIEDDGADEKRAELSKRVKASEEAFAQIIQQLKSSQNVLSALEAEKALLQNEREKLEGEIDSYKDRKELEHNLMRAEGQLNEVQRNFVADKNNDRIDTKIITEVVRNLEGRVKSVQNEILERVSKKILENAKRFGLENYSQIQLKGGGQLSIVKGGKPTSYSKVTQGEQLRLKVATMLAIISVSHLSGIGRHPGLLMIDSPGSQEIVGPDLEELMSGMAEVISELPFLQVFVASVATVLMSRHIDAEKCIKAIDDNYLW